MYVCFYTKFKGNLSNILSAVNTHQGLSRDLRESRYFIILNVGIVHHRKMAPWKCVIRLLSASLELMLLG